MNAVNVIHVDAFESTLIGHHARWFLPITNDIQYPSGFQEQVTTESPPFQRRFLILDPKSSEAWKLVDKWDAVFVPQSSTDWSLALTYLQHQPQAYVILTPEVLPPPAFFVKARQVLPKISLIHFQTFQQEGFKPLSLLQGYDDTFFPKIEDHNSEFVQGILQQTLSKDTLKNLVLKDILRDLRSAGASLVTSRSSLFWYYMSEHKKPNSHLETIIRTFLLRDV
jgi:hypothetical protein